MLRRLSLALGALFLVAAVADATSGEWVSVTCPICQNSFEGYEVHSSNTFGGCDRDFCEHARGGQVFILGCWTCPRCAYTGGAEDFHPHSLSKSLVARLKAKNPLVPAIKLDPKARRIDAIPAWVRWDLRSQVLALANASTEERAWARLRTAQTQRFDITRSDALVHVFEDLWATYVSLVPKQVPKKDYELMIAVARALEKDAEDPELPLTAPERRSRLLASARYFLHRGESPAAASVIAKLRRGEKERAPPPLEMLTELEQRIAREHEYIRHAVPLFERLTKEKEQDTEEQLSLSYLVGELHRKLGQTDKALGWLQPLMKKEIPDWLKLWVTEAIAKTKAAAD